MITCTKKKNYMITYNIILSEILDIKYKVIPL